MTAFTAVDALACTLFLVAAFVPAGWIHVWWLSSSRSKRWAVPVDGGRSWRGHRWFGDHKTWRGFFVLPPAAALSFVGMGTIASLGADRWLEAVGSPSMAHLALAGFAAGVGFMLGELPNSFIKRRAGIRPGAAAPREPLRTLFLLADRLDSLLGLLVALAWVWPPPVGTWLHLLIIGPAVHLAFSALLHARGGKARLA